MVETVSPPATRAETNALAIERELEWLSQVMNARLAAHDLPSGAVDGAEAAIERGRAALPLDCLYAQFVEHYELSAAERLCIALALAPHVRPELLDVLFEEDPRTGRGRTRVGGVRGRMHGGFLPTAETALFLLAGSDLARRFEAQRLFARDHVFSQHNLLAVEDPPPGEPWASGPLMLGSEILDFLTAGELRKPDFSRDFPARLLTTELDWDELVLSPSTLEQIGEVESWIRHESALMHEWGLGKRLRPGYRCLLHGPPGTGKTLTAALLGKRLGRDVYRVALSTVVSKYIGETEKNLERIFARAEPMRCILFFDEADALFGKRTGVKDAHDRYANQEVAYLLQRIEDYDGIVVLASNYGSNIDDAFMRRFESVVHFPLPDESERLRLWEASISERAELEEGLALEEIARQFELSGGAIMNVVRHASLMAIDSGSCTIGKRALLDGVRRELQKEGRSIG